jgi:hypothetical protein
MGRINHGNKLTRVFGSVFSIVALAFALIVIPTGSSNANALLLVPMTKPVVVDGVFVNISDRSLNSYADIIYQLPNGNLRGVNGIRSGVTLILNKSSYPNGVTGKSVNLY